MNDSTPAARTKVELPTFTRDSLLDFLCDSSIDEDEEIAHRCNVHDGLVQAAIDLLGLRFVNAGKDVPAWAWDKLIAAVEKAEGRAEASEAEAQVAICSVCKRAPPIKAGEDLCAFCAADEEVQNDIDGARGG